MNQGSPTMKRDLLIKRICAKLEAPDLFEPGVEIERCLPWPTKSAPSRYAMKRVRARDGGIYVAAAIIKNQTRLMVDGERILVHRAVYELINGPQEPYQGHQLCMTSFCVNPAHWAFTPLPQAYAPPSPPEEDEEWPLQDARDLLDMYLLRCPEPPLNPAHDLLVDIPLHILREALALVQKEDFLP